MAPCEPAPRGRPPQGHVWIDGTFVEAESLRVYAREEHEALLKETWRHAKREKYAANLDGRRDQNIARLAEKRRMKGAKPRSNKLPNSVLRSEPWDIKQSADKFTETQ